MQEWDQMRRQKKNDTLEIRLPQETKQAFMDQCRAEGRSASEAMRMFIEERLARPDSVAKQAARMEDMLLRA
jgi:hypothetical protein